MIPITRPEVSGGRVRLVPLLALAVAGLLLAAGPAFGAPPKPPQDRTPPGAVTGLVAPSPTHHTIDLTWTATADDGYDASSGPATRYDVRYTDGVLNESTWGSAFTGRAVPTAGAPGSVQGYTQYILLPDKTYQLGMKVIDEAGNASPISNVVTFTTLLGAWHIEIVDREAGPGYFSLAFAPDGFPSLSYTKSGKKGVYFAHFDGTARLFEPGAPIASCGTPESWQPPQPTPLAPWPGAAYSLTPGAALSILDCVQLRIEKSFTSPSTGLPPDSPWQTSQVIALTFQATLLPPCTLELLTTTRSIRVAPVSIGGSAELEGRNMRYTADRPTAHTMNAIGIGLRGTVDIGAGFYLGAEGEVGAAISSLPVIIRVAAVQR